MSWPMMRALPLMVEFRTVEFSTRTAPLRLELTMVDCDTREAPLTAERVVAEFWTRGALLIDLPSMRVSRDTWELPSPAAPLMTRVLPSIVDVPHTIELGDTNPVDATLARVETGPPPLG